MSIRIEKEVVLRGEHGQVLVKALIDTGATVTVIPKSIAQKIGATNSGQTVELQGFDGTTRECPIYFLSIGFPTLKKSHLGR